LREKRHKRIAAVKCQDIKQSHCCGLEVPRKKALKKSTKTETTSGEMILPKILKRSVWL